MTDIAVNIKTWLDEADRDLVSARFSQVDLDWLLDGPVPADAAQASLAIYRQLIHDVVDRGWDHQVMLTLPLTWSIDGISLLRPDIEALLDEPWTNIEIPGFYIIRGDLWAQYEEVEEYRLPLDIDIQADRNVVCYYRCFRSVSPESAPDEYQRVVYFRAE